MTFLDLQSCLSGLFCWLNLLSVVFFFINTYIFQYVYNLRKTIKFIMLTKIKVYNVEKYIFYKYWWSVQVNLKELTPVMERQWNGGRRSISMWFLHIFKHPVLQWPCRSFIRYRDASCHLRFLLSSERIPGQSGSFFMYPKQFFYCIGMGFFSIDCNSYQFSIL